MKSAVVLGAFAVNLYVLGAMLVFALVSYPGFAPLDREAYARFTGTIGVAVVPFELLAFLVPLLLYATRPQPLGAVHAAVALGVVYFAITFAWHLPAHRALPGSHAALMTSQWVRTAVQLARVAVLGWLSVRQLFGGA